MERREVSALLTRAKAGSTEAMDELYRRYAPKLLALIRLRLGKSLRANLESRDILQATLLKSFRKMPQFEGSESGSFIAWLGAIARNEIRDQADYYQRKRRDVASNVPLDEELGGVANRVRSALSQAIWTEEAGRLEQALESLEEHYREVIILRKFEELTYREIAGRLGKSEDSCRMMFARAMTALTLEMEALA
jgi:RNA polymerase sigma-70 factor (ECF subfamily)